MNSVHLIGRLATDVEVKEVNGGSKVSSFILAVDRNAEEADFFRIKAWNSQAEAAGDHLGKGRRIAVEGSLRQDVYEKEGVALMGFWVLAICLDFFLGGGVGGGGRDRPPAPPHRPFGHDSRRRRTNERR